MANNRRLPSSPLAVVVIAIGLVIIAAHFMEILNKCN